MAEATHGQNTALIGSGGMIQSEITAWLTHSDQRVLFQRQPLRFGGLAQDYPVLTVDTDRVYQTMEGFGFSLTGGSAYLMNNLPEDEKAELLMELFSPEGEGIGVSYLRLSLGASDLSDHSFSYDDGNLGEEDWELARFNILAGDRDVIPVLQQILAINPDLTVIATPWSAPTWMKTNQQWKGGSLRPECHAVYARYFVEYIRAMKDHGVTIHAITPQNEPLNQKNDPSMLMTPEEQAAFIRYQLGPALRNAGFGGVEIYCWDHNCDRPDYPLAVLADAKAREYIAGVAWHLYGGDISVLSKVQAVFPDKKMLFTEQWVGRDGQFSGDLNWHIKNVVVGSCKNWSRAVLEWNLASDPDCGPHTQGGEPNCVGALTIGAGIQRNVAYYIIAHVAKFVRPGSIRIFSSEVDYLPNVAFKTLDNQIVLVVLNESQERRGFNIQFRDKNAVGELEGGSVATYVWVG